MAKFYGQIGFVRTSETSPGIFTEKYIERTYTGDVVRNTRRWENSGQLNDNLALNNTVSIVADDFMTENLFAMRYVRWMGVTWRVSNVEIQRPRLILTIGGVCNVPEDTITETPGENSR